MPRGILSREWFLSRNSLCQGSVARPGRNTLSRRHQTRENDLIIASHAGGFYILDDVTPLQELARAMSRKIALFQPMRATRYVQASDTSVLGNAVWVARNKPYGAIISYYLAGASSGPVQLTILDAAGKTLQTLGGNGNAGVNRVVWGLQGPGCQSVGTAQAAAAGRGGRGGGRGGGGGPRVMPGEYRVRLTALGETAEQTFTVRLDPRVKSSAEDLSIYSREVNKMQGTECLIGDANGRIGGVEPQLAALEGKLPNAELRAQTANVAKELAAVRANLSEVSSRLRWLAEQVGNHLGRPAAAQIEWIGIYDQRVREASARLDALWKGDLVRLNTGLQAAGLPAIRLN
jgi:hypothetical protein